MKYQTAEKYLGLILIAVAVPIGVATLIGLDSSNVYVRSIARFAGCIGAAALVVLPVCELIISRAAEESNRAFYKKVMTSVKTARGRESIVIQRYVGK